MNAHYTYRQTTTNDLPEIKALGLLSYGQFASVLSPDNWQKLYNNLQNDQFWIDLLSTSTGFLCIQEKVVGMAFLISNGHPTSIFDASWAYVRMVGVDPAHRGNSLSKHLMNQCIKAAKENKEHTLALHTSEFMDAARHTYESMGFRQVKELAPIFDKRYWLYHLDLTA